MVEEEPRALTGSAGKERRAMKKTAMATEEDEILIR